MSDYSFWLGEEGDDSPRVSVTYSNWDYLEGLPDEETEIPERFMGKMPEECPEMIVFDEADYEE